MSADWKFGAEQDLSIGMQVLLFVLALVCARLALHVMMPLFSRYALARPNARSSHKVPTPQGGGIAFMAITLLLGLPLAAEQGLALNALLIFGVILAGMVLLGAWDDIHPLSWRIRLCLQMLMVMGILVILPQEWRVLPALPLLVERGFALVLGLWFINLTNFMDGIDGMLVAGLAPMALALGTGFGGVIPPHPLALAFSGALCGFLLVNRPPAKLFSGDAGALAAGLLSASLLYVLAARYSLFAALILPLYFGVDATQTLLMRLYARKNITEAHRDHAYQRAVDQGWPALRVITQVALLNTLLVLLAGLALIWPKLGIFAFMAGLLLTFGLIYQFRAER